MYRRDISPLLMWLALAVFLLIGIHQFFPSFLEKLAPPVHSVSVESDKPIADPPPSPLPLSMPTPSTRLIELPPLPLSTYEVPLAIIRDDIEAHRFLLAESKLLALPRDVLSDKTSRAYIAGLWNNLGIEQELIHGTAGSLSSFKRAAALDDSSPVILMNLAHASWERRDPALDQELLEKLIGVAPQEPFPHLALADWLQEHDRIDEAERHLSHATDRIGRDPALRSYLASVTTKIHRKETAEPRAKAQDEDG
ncbi:MAG: hypothetical protein NNA20_08110 [Nitrospira sp.]|nr:hypothetical protein [Nitrospira sp.]MCP9442544.1 hypothetical protein [Nitrospira sp.]